MPAFAKDIADYQFMWDFIRGRTAMVCSNGVSFCKVHRVPDSFLVHNLHKTSIEVCLWRLPLLFEEGKTHKQLEPGFLRVLNQDQS